MKKNKKQQKSRSCRKGGYINPLQLIQTASSEHVDFDALMDTVNWERAKRDQARSSEGQPPSILFTNSPQEEENFAKLPPPVKEELRMLNSMVEAQPEFVLSRLQFFKDKFPDVPMIYNLEGNVYMKLDDLEQFYRIAQEALEKFPDYLFAKVALAEYYIRNENYNEIKNVFQEKLHIQHHFPSSKKEYHLSEVRAFYNVVGIYYAYTGNLPMALWCYSLLVTMEGKTSVSSRLAKVIVLQEMKLIINR